MRILPEPVVFEWDLGNLDKNWGKHKVRNKEAEEVFFSDAAQIFEDAKHSGTEKRYMLWGVTGKNRMLAVVFTLRAGNVRIISARDMHRKERTIYEEKSQSHT